MANVTIGQIAVEATTVADDDLFEMETSGGSTRKVKSQTIKKTNSTPVIYKNSPTPESIDNCYLWLDFADTAYMTKDISDYVSQVIDKSINRFIATASGTAKPLYVFEEGLTFDGVDDFLSVGSASDWTFLHDGTGATAFIVLETREANPDRNMAFFSTSTTASIGMIYTVSDDSAFSRNDGTQFFNFNGTDLVFNRYDNNILTQQTDTILSFRYETEAGNDLNLYNFAVNYANYNNSFTPSSADPTQALAIGAVGGGGAGLHRFDGKIKEVIIYNRKITEAEHALVLAYLNLKWLGTPSEASYSLTNENIIYGDCTTGDIKLTLPVCEIGKEYIIKKIDTTANKITVETTDMQVIDGEISKIIDVPYEAIKLNSDGNRWYLIYGEFLQYRQNKLMIEVDGTFELPIESKKGFGFVGLDWIDGSVYFEFAEDGTFHTSSINGNISQIKDTASNLNIYTETAKITLQNKMATAVEIQYYVRWF